MARRNSPNAINGLADLSHLSEHVFDKRQGQRAAAKKHRRNRHYEKQFIRNTLTHLPPEQAAPVDTLAPVQALDRPLEREGDS